MTRNTWLHFLHRRLYDGGNKKTHEYVCSGNGQDSWYWKTESYWLIKKNYFKTILVGNTMRVMIDSFEEWYANQFKYQKVDGTPPGEELNKTTYSRE